jgi:hypothetical protein
VEVRRRRTSAAREDIRSSVLLCRLQLHPHRNLRFAASFFRCARVCKARCKKLNTHTWATDLPLATTIEPRQRKHLRRFDREEKFLTRKQLAERWQVSIREIINREKTGPLKGFVHRFSYKVHRYRLSDIVALEEAAKVN